MNIKSRRGSILLSTLSFIILLAVAAASILELTMNSYKLTMRNEMRVQARSVAESELESVYFQWVSLIMTGVPAAQSPAALSAVCDVDPNPMTTAFSAYLAAHRTQGWVVHRGISYNSAYDFFDGIIPSTTKHGQVTYITVKIEVLPNPSSPFRNELAVRVGRRFATSTSTIFQYGVFYQGDLEMAPGNNVVIDGDVAANGSIYMAASAGRTLTLNKQVRYLTGDYFNQDSLGNTVLRKPGTPVGGALVAPIFGTSQASQLEVLSQPENLLGGVDASLEVALHGPAHENLFQSENDVYRAAIVPPPGQTDEYPNVADDPTIAVQRMYNRAGLIVTVNTDNTVVITKPDGTVVTGNYPGVISGTVNKAVYDQREGKNVYITTLDMGALTTKLQDPINYVAGPNDFNGLVYVNVKSSNTTTPRAVRMINATNVTGRKGNGMSIATNGGMYVQGDFNTASTPLADGSTNPAMIMADQVTALSAGWDDANADQPRTSRVATAAMAINAGILTGNTPADATHFSGGAQNLLRYLENWNGKPVTITGSLGCLFQSKTFNSYWQQPGNIYGAPSARNFTFDAGLLSHPPAGSPQTTAFERGSFFVW